MRKKPSKIRSLVLESLQRGEFKVGDKLPTEGELTRQYGYSRTVIREGLSSLVEEGILTRRQGSGTFVSSLSRRKSQVIAAMVHCVHDRWKSMATVIRSIEDEANADGHSLILCNHDGRAEKALQYVERLLREGVAGVIYTPVWHGDALAANLEVVSRLERAGVPFVLIGSPISFETQVRFSFVGSNGYSATRRMTQHLLQLGHRRLAYIRGLAGVLDAEERFGGFLSAMAEAKIQVPSEYVKQIKPLDVEQQGQEEIRELLAADPPPTAVLCVHDVLARNVILELQRLGRRVPEDVAVVGFDDLPFAETFNPPLTTMQPPTWEEGKRAVQVLRGKLEGSLREEQQIFLDCELKVRRSCGATPELRSEVPTKQTAALTAP